MQESVFHCTFVEKDNWSLITQVITLLVNEGIIWSHLRMFNLHIWKSNLDTQSLQELIASYSKGKLTFMILKLDDNWQKNIKIFFKSDFKDPLDEPKKVEMLNCLPASLIGTDDQILDKILDKISKWGRHTLTNQEEEWLLNKI
jgi:hypothetical protein